MSSKAKKTEVLRVLLREVAGGAKHRLNLNADGVNYIGRAARSAVVIDDVAVSSQHVELSAKPSSSGKKDEYTLWARSVGRNGTGIKSLSADGTPGTMRRLGDKEPEEVKDGSELVVPFRRKGEETDETDTRVTFSVMLNTHEVTVPVVPGVAGPKPPVEPQKSPDGDAAECPVPPPSKSNPDLDLANLPDIYDPVMKTGRWRYDEKLGEGGLGVVYRGFDITGPHGEVALKVLKPRSKIPQKDARFVFEMHRESQWSLWYLHNKFDIRVNQESSALFARYLEDHTGFSEFGPDGFDKKRRAYEAPDFDWDKDGPTIPARPYVVMELVKGEALHVVIDREWYRSKTKPNENPPIMRVEEKREVLFQAAQALEYLQPLGLIHRDFRGCNMHLVSRRTATSAAQLKVLDLGVMICAEDGQELNSNQAVQAFRRRGETEEKRRRYDWLPWEVRKGADGTGPAVNFSPPTHSFDVFSLGVLVLHMLIGRTQTRDFLDSLKHNENSRVGSGTLGLDPEMLVKMLQDDPGKRPHPRDVVEALRKVAVPKTVRAADKSRSRSNSATRGSAKRARITPNGTNGAKSRADAADVPLVPASKGKAELTNSKFWVMTVQLPPG